VVRIADVVLLVGYGMAVPFTLYVPGFLRLWRRRETWVFVTAEVGALLIAIGWAVKGNLPTAAFNALWCVGFGAVWLLQGRRSVRPA
jgi:hypothetical protein